MLPVFFTIDTEYSPGLYLRGGGRTWRENFARSIGCALDGGGDVGIRYQMDTMDRHGLKGVFFVDPMPALVWGREAVAAVVGPIMARGHDVQLHLHPEWLQFVPADSLPAALPAYRGNDLADYPLAEQRALLAFAAQELVAAGAPRPVAFRAGNYGANDDTLLALADLGIALDSSFPPGLEPSACAISLGRHHVFPRRHMDVVEVPIGAIDGQWQGRRHAQLTAMSQWELRAATRHAVTAGWPAFVIVSHSFEMFNRRKGVANRIVRRRFESFCAWLGAHPQARSATFAEAGLAERLIAGPPVAAGSVMPLLLPRNPLRQALRVGEQALSNLVYG